MTTQELYNKFWSITSSGNGFYKVTIIYRGERYWTRTTNLDAVFRVLKCINYRSSRDKSEGNFGLTLKQALTSLYNEVKRDNDLR